MNNNKNYVHVKRAIFPGRNIGSYLIDEIAEAKIIELSMKLITPLHISEGGPYVLEGIPTYLLQRMDGKILIPGSSIKGAMRTYFEIFFDDAYSKEIFGSSDRRMSRLLFSDVLIPESPGLTEIVVISPQYTPKKFPPQREKFYRLYRCFRPINGTRNLRRRRKVEVLKENKDDSIPNLKITAYGLDRLDIANFLTAIGANPNAPFHIKIGRAKEQGYGEVRISLVGVKSPDGENIEINFSAVEKGVIKKALEIASMTGCKGR